MIYAYVDLTVTDPDSFQRYAEQAGPLLQKWGAKAQAMSTTPTLLEGEGTAPGRAVLLSFPDRDSAIGWIEDPEAKDIHTLRRAAGPCRITLIG